MKGETAYVLQMLGGQARQPDALVGTEHPRRFVGISEDPDHDLVIVAGRPFDDPEVPEVERVERTREQGHGHARSITQSSYSDHGWPALALSGRLESTRLWPLTWDVNVRARSGVFTLR